MAQEFLASGSSGVPVGVIVMWSGRIASIPAGWFLCNGQNGTPDLRDRFVVGASQDSGGVAKTNVSGSLTQTGGSSSHIHSVSVSGGGSLNTGSGVASGSGWSNGISNMSGGGVATTIASGSHFSPYFALAYIMKG